MAIARSTLAALVVLAVLAALIVLAVVTSRREGLAAETRAPACVQPNLPAPCTVTGAIAYDARLDDCVTWFPQDNNNQCPAKSNSFATKASCMAACKPGLLPVRIPLYMLPRQKGSPFYVDMGDAQQYPGMIVIKKLPRGMKSVDVPANYMLQFSYDNTPTGTLTITGPKKANIPAPFDTLRTVRMGRMP